MSSYNDAYDRYTREANEYATQFGLDPATAHNGEWDAFRHAYASGAMTQDYGESVANWAGEANELRGDWTHDQPPREMSGSGLAF